MATSYSYNSAVSQSVSQSVSPPSNSKLGQTPPNFSKLLQTPSKLFQTLSTLVQTLSKCVQTRPNVSKRVQMHLNAPNLSKHDQRHRNRKPKDQGSLHYSSKMPFCTNNFYHYSYNSGGEHRHEIYFKTSSNSFKLLTHPNVSKRVQI